MLSMKPCNFHIFHLLVILLCCASTSVGAKNVNDLLDNKITFPQTQGSIYELLNLITEQTNLLFIYDSNIVDNEQPSSIPQGEYSIREAIHIIIGNSSLSLQLVDNYILIQTSRQVSPRQSKITEEEACFTISGALYDKETQEPIIYASVGIGEAGIGTITNQEGKFKLKLPLSLLNAEIIFSHLGYLPQHLSCRTIANKQNRFLLEPSSLSLQEIVVRAVNPLVVINEMLEKRRNNHSESAVYLTTFYREGVERKKDMVSLSEGVFKVVKMPFHSKTTDQVKLLKMRKVSNTHEKDTLITKIKSGINACLLLDIIKQLPDFLRAESESPYLYTHADITIIDSSLVDVISFKQNPSFKEPLYEGNIYIDKDNKALLKTEFQIQPEHIKKATNMFVERKSKRLQIIPQEIKYTVSYKKWNGKYYINHVRGDLRFRIKKKRLLSSTTPVHTWFEMATCKIETEDVSRFSRSETLSTRTIFADTHFEYDNTFWGEFNTIIPENELSEAIRQISTKIEETNN